MSTIKLETGRLKDIDERYFYRATCSACKHAARLSIRKLQQHLGGEYPLTRIRPRLRCEMCGHRGCVITFLPPESLTGSLVYLRAEKSPN